MQVTLLTPGGLKLYCCVEFGVSMSATNKWSGKLRNVRKAAKIIVQCEVHRQSCASGENPIV